MADLTPYRGKRAILLGMPLTLPAYKRWRAAVLIAVPAIGLEYADEWFGTPAAETLVREAAHIGAACVLIVGRNRWRTQTRALGLPVLRVRRDGSVEVHDG